MSKNNSELEDKILGALFGFAIGDAMGATTEFMTADQIYDRYGRVENIIGGGWLGLNAGDVTDDTQMMLCVADALMSNPRPKSTPHFANLCGQNFVKWLETNPKDVGGQCLKGISNFANHILQPLEENALGNGSLMRALPCALYNNQKWNVAQGQLTHNNRICSNAIKVYHSLVQSLLAGVDPNIPCPYAVGDNKATVEPTGYVLNTLYNAMVYLDTSDSFEEAIIRAVNAGGDADTIAALTGGLVGAKFGFYAIPGRWVTQLDIQVRVKLVEFKNFLVS